MGSSFASLSSSASMRERSGAASSSRLRIISIRETPVIRSLRLDGLVRELVLVERRVETDVAEVIRADQLTFLAAQDGADEQPRLCVDRERLLDDAVGL